MVAARTENLCPGDSQWRICSADFCSRLSSPASGSPRRSFEEGTGSKASAEVIARSVAFSSPSEATADGGQSRGTEDFPEGVGSEEYGRGMERETGRGWERETEAREEVASPLRRKAFRRGSTPKIHAFASNCYARKEITRHFPVSLHHLPGPSLPVSRSPKAPTDRLDGFRPTTPPNQVSASTADKSECFASPVSGNETSLSLSSFPLLFLPLSLYSSSPSMQPWQDTQMRCRHATPPKKWLCHGDHCLGRYIEPGSDSKSFRNRHGFVEWGRDRMQQGRYGPAEMRTHAADAEVRRQSLSSGRCRRRAGVDYSVPWSEFLRFPCETPEILGDPSRTRLPTR